jgi:hypothetical protein
MMPLQIAGGILLGSGIALDLMFRLQMARLGQWAPLFKGGSFNYAEYHRVRIKQGWPAWPVYVMWALYVCGIGLLVAGFFAYFGTQPQRGVQGQ